MKRTLMLLAILLSMGGSVYAGGGDETDAESRERACMMANGGTIVADAETSHAYDYQGFQPGDSLCIGPQGKVVIIN